MKSRLYPAAARGKADFGWLQANFSFSFGSYYDPDNVQFGALRVLNDDTIAAGMGFGSHPHDNMEIVTIPLQGGLQHRDSMGNEGVIREGDVQVMSAGTGVLHSEMNASTTEVAKTLQIWVMPELRRVKPRYEQMSFDRQKMQDQFYPIVTPHDRQQDGAVWIYQQSYFSLGEFSPGKTASYRIRIPGNVLYVFLISGKISAGGEVLQQRDALGVRNLDALDISIEEPSRILLIEIPA